MTKMGEVVCFDTAPLIWGVPGEASRGQEREIERTKRYIKLLKNTNKQIMIPTPVLTEYLVGATATECKELEVLKQGFQIGNYDLASAVLAAELQRGDMIRLIQEDFGVERQCVKADAQIIAIAIINHSSRIITNDFDHFRVLSRGRIHVSGIPEIQEQTGLDFSD